VFAYTNVGRL